MSKILVTGGTGFIGSHITRFLVQSGNSVRVLDNNTRGKLDRISDIASEIEFIEGDISNSTVTELACKDMETVIHLAFINGTSNFYDFPDKVLNVAIQGMLSVATAVTKWDIQNLVLASSSEVYQFPKVFPTPEDVEMVIPELSNPRYSYGLGKIIQEFYSYHAMPKLKNLTIFRPHNIYGSDMGNLHVIPQIFEKVIKSKMSGETFTIEGDGSQTRSFCHINDFIQAFSLILNVSSGKQVFNIGTREEVSINNLVDKVTKIVGVENLPSHSPIREGGTSRRLPDISKIESLGFSQKVTLDQGLGEYFSGVENQILGRNKYNV
jgi:nucleoside-diphosphate-sugar epimerase